MEPENVAGPKAVKAQSRTSELIVLFDTGLNRLEKRLEAVLREQMPEKAESQPAESTQLNKSLADLQERLSSVVKRIEL